MEKAITKHTTVEHADKVYKIVLTNKSVYEVTGDVADKIVKLAPGTLVKLPSGDYINKSHVVEMFKDAHRTMVRIQNSRELSTKYGQLYIGNAC